MNLKSILCSLSAAMLLLVSCDSDTASLGGSLTPSEDSVAVRAGLYYATTRSIDYNDSLLARTSVCYLGRFTDPATNTVVQAGYLTQVNCIEDFLLPDSVYGLDKFHFPEWVDSKTKGEAPFSANLSIYYKQLFGDSTNVLNLEVYALDKAIDVEKKYYADVDPVEFYDETAKPLANVMICPTDFSESDSIRQLKNYYKRISVNLPESFAREILEKYYSENGKEYFKDVTSFMKNVCKGFYIRCTRGDGTIIYAERTDLDLHFKYLEKSASGKADSLLSVVTNFSGNSEVMQFSHFENTGLAALKAESNCTYLRTPYGLLTESTLPIDKMTEDGSTLNSASISFTRINNDSQHPYMFTTPKYILMLRKSEAVKFFEGASKADNKTSYAASYSSTYNQYTFNNIARLIEISLDERTEWLEKKGMKDDAAGHAAYAAAFPDWDKVILVPATSVKDANNSVIGYSLDLGMKSTRLVGGPDGESITIKTIHSSF